jgi:hypothetical protein
MSSLSRTQSCQEPPNDALKVAKDKKSAQFEWERIRASKVFLQLVWSNVRTEIWISSQ